MRRLGGKGPVALLGLVGALALLAVAFRPWVSGAVDDAVLGATRISATGDEVAPGLTAVALAVAAAAVATVAGGRITRVVALVGWAGLLTVAVGLTVRVVLDPDGVLGPVAASRVGRTGSVETAADPTAWPWVALGAAALALLGLVGAVLGMARWAGPSARYEVPDGAGGTVAGPRGERVGSDWDELSAGRDPTDVGPDRTT
ncbi:Trp biosynthesis-associated membrane protein [Oryzobacter telluris]|uniref:Trp biosynthesis-associated membrane protein n=1 Tax=Oryzobacter telluris TaxID=3149179 RepID=UPI00370D4F2E